MLGNRRMTPKRGAAQDAAAPERTDLKTGKAYLNEAYTPTTTSGKPPIKNDQRPYSKGDRPYNRRAPTQGSQGRPVLCFL